MIRPILPVSKLVWGNTPTGPECSDGWDLHSRGLGSPGTQFDQRKWDEFHKRNGDFLRFYLGQSTRWVETNPITSLAGYQWDYLRSPAKNFSFFAGYLADWQCLWTSCAMGLSLRWKFMGYKWYKIRNGMVLVNQFMGLKKRFYGMGTGYLILFNHI